jgi:hypothetical protein
MARLRKSTLAALTAVWAMSAYGQNAPSQPSPGDVAGALKTMQDAAGVMKAKRTEAAACEDKVRKSDEFKPIARRIPPPGSKPTPALLADRTPASADEARAMAAVAPKFRDCRRTWEDAEITLVPGMKPVLAQYEERHAAIIANLVDRKLGWGAYYRAQMASSQKLKAERAKVRAAAGQTAKSDDD